MKEVDNERSFRFKYFSIQMKKVKFQLSYQEVYSLQETLKYNSNFGNKKEFQIHSSETCIIPSEKKIF